MQVYQFGTSKFLDFGSEKLNKHYVHTMNLLYPKSILYIHIFIYIAINMQHEYLYHI